MYSGFWDTLYNLGYSDDEIFREFVNFWEDLNENWIDAL